MLPGEATISLVFAICHPGAGLLGGSVEFQHTLVTILSCTNGVDFVHGLHLQAQEAQGSASPSQERLIRDLIPRCCGELNVPKVRDASTSADSALRVF